MKPIDHLKLMVIQFLVVNTGTIIAMAVFCQIYYPQSTFGVERLYEILLYDLAGVLPSLIFCSSRELTGRQFLVRKIVHFIVLEVVLLVLAYWLNWIYTMPEILTLAASIFCLYIVVWIVSWQVSLKTACRINERLQRLNPKSDEE